MNLNILAVKKLPKHKYSGGLREWLVYPSKMKWIRTSRTCLINSTAAAPLADLARRTNCSRGEVNSVMGRSAWVSYSLMAGESLFMKIPGIGDFFLPELLGEREHYKPPCRDFIWINTGYFNSESIIQWVRKFYCTHQIFKMQYIRHSSMKVSFYHRLMTEISCQRDHLN